jgi:prefoldin subunit 5
MADDWTPRRTQETDPVRALAQQLADLRKQVEALGKSASLRNASISGGDGLTVKDDDGNIRLRVSPAGGAIIAYNAAGDEVARYGQLAHVDVGQFGIEALTGAGWSHVGSGGTSWNAIDSKPSTFPPSYHRHSGGDIDGNVGGANYANNAGLASEAEGSGYAWNNNVGGTSWYAVYVGNNGGFKFGRNTSSARYKENIRDFTGDVSDLMALRPVLFDRIPQLDPAPTWTDPETGEEFPAEGPRNLEPGRKDEFGFIAEEVLEIWPEVVQWFDHGDGLGPQVDGIRYEMIGARLVPILQGMLLNVRTAKRQLVDLGARVTSVEDTATASILALRNRVKALEDAAAITKAKLASQDTLIAGLDARLKTLGA